MPFAATVPVAAVPRPVTPRPPSSRSAPVSRFRPGEIFAGRYRIVALLGRGGMGEVYRADDLVLEQPVALKFLHADVSADPAARERFLSEVKLARAVTHPNVCRVHDLGELDGLPFLSMEYVDGEDLAALLRRVGAPSEKKALEIAGQICTGLAAAHAKGVLHRDLKPANVMIDGAGKVRITDFGLAIIADDERQALAGTPAYIAPEQFTGSAASIRTDLYALGLVLYELFTGVRVWQAHDLPELLRQHATKSIEPPSIHGVVNDRVERAILSCLDGDPARRPRSATAVAVALTGADPIAAALAAGETPTPEMVADSGGEGTLSVKAAGALVATIVSLLVALCLVAPNASVYGTDSLDLEPAVLAHRAREILTSVGLDLPDGDRASGIAFLQVPAANGAKRIKPEFWYREAPFSMQRGGLTGPVGYDDPPIHWPGMAALHLSMAGGLRLLESAPVISGDPERVKMHCDWKPLFAAAGLPAGGFKEIDPQELPSQTFDELVAWVVPDVEDGGPSRVVEGAACEGKPVSFRVDSRSRREPAYLLGFGTANLAQDWLMIAALIGGGFLARRNIMSGRGDRRAALRLAVLVVAAQVGATLLRDHHSDQLQLEFALFEHALGSAMYVGATVWLVYLAIEPYVRRIWPDYLISWSRLLSGRWRDALVSRDLLVGLAAGALGTLITLAQAWSGMRLGAPEAMPRISNFPEAAGASALVAQLGNSVFIGIWASFVLLFALVALRFLVRRAWLSYLLFVPLALLANENANPTGSRLVDWTSSLGLAVLLLVVVARFGFFALAVGITTFFFLLDVPFTSHLTSWYGGQAIFGITVVGGLALAAAGLACRRPLLAPR